MNFEERFMEVVRLAAETGDRVILMIPDVDPCVVMSIASYRSLLESASAKHDLSHLNERGLLDKINQQIAEWRETQDRQTQEYDLSQFSVESRMGAGMNRGSQLDVAANKTVEKPSLPMGITLSPPPKQADEAKVTNLPTIGDGDEHEYKLEPLS